MFLSACVCIFLYLFTNFSILCMSLKRRVRSDSVQSDQKSAQEDTEDESESSMEKKIPGDFLVNVQYCIRGNKTLLQNTRVINAEQE